MDLLDLLQKTISVVSPKYSSSKTNGPNSYSPDLQLPQISVKLPQPLRYPPDMDPNPAAKDWLNAGALKIPYDLDANGNKAVLYLGYLLCDCDRDVPISIEMYAYADWLSRRKPLCGDTLQTHVRSQKNDQQILEKTDYLLGTYLSGGDCEPWGQQQKIGSLCV